MTAENWAALRVVYLGFAASSDPGLSDDASVSDM